MEAWDSTPATLPQKRERLAADAFNDLLTLKDMCSHHMNEKKKKWEEP